MRSGSPSSWAKTRGWPAPRPRARDGRGAAGRTRGRAGPEGHISRAAAPASRAAPSSAMPQDGVHARPYLIDRRSSSGLGAGRLHDPASARLQAPRCGGADARARSLPYFQPDIVPCCTPRPQPSWADRVTRGSHCMTRSTLKRTLRRIYALLVLVLGDLVVAKIADHMPVLAGTGLGAAPQGRLRISARHVAADRHRRRRLHHQRVPEALELRRGAQGGVARHHRHQVGAVRLHPARAADAASSTSPPSASSSETIDNMRSVYQNVGETGDLIGLYPYAPLHDMRRALQTLDPRKNPNAGRRGAQPGARCHPAVVLRPARDLPGGARPRGAGPSAADLGRPPRQGERLDRQRRAAPRTAQRGRQDRVPPPDPRIDELLAELYAKESTTAKPWRQPAAARARRVAQWPRCLAERDEGGVTAPPR